ncbi:MAG: Flp family type IVb pilin [Acidimicrobiales bacterium]|nr:Flp family type IVb pilin [Acidimicrobiales bacterium]
MKAMIRRLSEREEGASLVEYALLIAMIAVVCLSALAFFGSGNRGSLGGSAECIGETSQSGGTVHESCQ